MIINTLDYNIIKVEDKIRSYVLYLQHKITNEKLLTYIEKSFSHNKNK
jgi:hypothetical protein